MAIVDSNQIEDEFTEAKNNWELEKLYLDLASAKGKALTPVEKKFLRGLLCGCSPAEIAKVVYQSRSSSTVRVYLSNGLYKYIEEMLSNQAGYSVKVKNWSRVTHLLEKSGYKKGWSQTQPATSLLKTKQEQEPGVVHTKSTQIQDWGEAIDVSGFYGRVAELATVKEWIVQERCRLVVLLGMGGIGKTAFSVKLAEEIKDDFDYVIWRSLHLSPTLDIILNQILEIFFPKAETKSTATFDSKISQLIDCLRSYRCLLILDHVDSILCSDDGDVAQEYSNVSSETSGIKNTSVYVSPIRYRQGYENYTEFIRRVGDSQHQSCLVLTSREKPSEIASREGEKLLVRSLKLAGISQVESILILQAKGFGNLKDEECKLLNYWYGGNPLFIKLVASTIQEIFAGSIYDFLEQNIRVFGDIREILDQQFNRLSLLEKQIMYWIALTQDVVSLHKLQKETIPGWSKRLSQRLILEALELLHKRSLVEKHVSSFSQIPVLREYIVERLIEENFKLSEDKKDHLLINNKIFEAQLKNYIHESRLNGEM
ncbi:NB-ARC domain-containing protein [Nostoc sp. UHCC 0302]|uniref:NB-ARC domain-containing protein n=1 Tax=Nostoc sp. UHCC 0302 TaxID=3134896 RepID=UPI00311C92FD